MIHGLMLKTRARGVLGVLHPPAPPICKPLRNVALLDEDSVLDMKRVHITKKEGSGSAAPPFVNL